MSNLLTTDGSTGNEIDTLRDKEQDYGMENEQHRMQRRGFEIRGDRHMHQHQKEYTREATMIVNVSEVDGGKAEDVINALIAKVGVDKILSVRPRLNKEFEITLENVIICESLKEGLSIKETVCEVRSLHARECVVSFMHLPAYTRDEEIISKLNAWGVSVASEIKRRYYPGTNITDGTRYVRVKFSKDVVSLPYSTRFETEEGAKYFRIIHDRQVKTCRLCMGPGHVMKDCSEFKCRDCGELGHFARECDAVRCIDCRKVLIKCECWMESGNEPENHRETEEAQNVEDLVEEQTELMEKDKEEQAREDVENDVEIEHEGGSQRNKEEEQDLSESQEEEEEMEGERGDDNKKDWEKVSTTRRRALKVKPNVEKAKRRHLLKMKIKEKGIHRGECNQNRFEVLDGANNETE